MPFLMPQASEIIAAVDGNTISGVTVEQFDAQCQEEAERQVKSELVLDKIAEGSKLYCHNTILKNDFARLLVVKE